MGPATAVVLVDDRGNRTGIAEKLQAHRDGLRHRACSVFVFDPRGRLLLQRRAPHKYHSGGLWSNTCCGHPLPGEPPHDAAHRRLRDEMGFDCELCGRGALVYDADVGGGLVEREYDYLFVGRFSGTPVPNGEEVAGWRWAEAATIHRELAERPHRFTAWFPIAWRRLLAAPEALGDEEAMLHAQTEL